MELEENDPTWRIFDIGKTFNGGQMVGRQRPVRYQERRTTSAELPERKKINK
jgi:hypothetical protein